jgi:hypothetical protein
MAGQGKLVDRWSLERLEPMTEPTGEAPAVLAIAVLVQAAKRSEGQAQIVEERTELMLPHASMRGNIVLSRVYLPSSIRSISSSTRLHARTKSMIRRRSAFSAAL